jgi:hypothetical protein
MESSLPTPRIGFSHENWRPAMVRELDRIGAHVSLAAVKAESSFYNPLRAADGARAPASQMDKTYGLLITA